MGAKSKAGTIRRAACKRAAKAPAKPGPRARTAPAAWEQTAQVPEERDDEIDCQRVVEDEGGRTRPRYFDDYN